MTRVERILQIALENEDEKLANSIVSNIRWIESPKTFFIAKKFPNVFKRLEEISNNCFHSYMSDYNARGIRSVLIVTNSLNAYKSRLISNSNGYLLEMITREILSEARISDTVIEEILKNTPTCFILTSICLICEQWKQNENYTDEQLLTFQKRVDNLFILRPEILCKRLLKYWDYFSNEFKKKLIFVNG